MGVGKEGRETNWLKDREPEDISAAHEPQSPHRSLGFPAGPVHLFSLGDLATATPVLLSCLANKDYLCFLWLLRFPKLAFFSP